MAFSGVIRSKAIDCHSHCGFATLQDQWRLSLRTGRLVVVSSVDENDILVPKQLKLF
jgi:hypothetical protein